MLDTMQITEQRPTRFATSPDFCAIFTEEMHSLYLLAFLLTADHDRAEQCFARGLEACEEGTGVFVEGARSWARRTILKLAIRLVRPMPEDTDHVSLSALKHVSSSERDNYFAAILALNRFDRFVFVTSVLEGQSDDECTSLLGCSRQDLIISRKRAFMRLSATEEGSYLFEEGHQA
jgi:DNA-directed RNA polymerase specialized sigma24 family protein